MYRNCHKEGAGRQKATRQAHYGEDNQHGEEGEMILSMGKNTPQRHLIPTIKAFTSACLQYYHIMFCFL